jgi:hypothetical protein
MPVPAAAHVLAWVALGSGLVFVAVRQGDLDRRLSVAEKAPPAAAPSPAAADDPAREAELAVLRGRVETSERANASQVEEVRKEVQRLWAEWMRSPAGGPDLATLSADPAFEDAVRGVVDRYAMERKFREAVQKASGPLVPKKPSFEQLAKALELKPPQAERFASEIRAIQTELYELLAAPRADGVALLEEIQQAEQFPEGSPKRTETFLKLFKLTIPDTEETYVERAILLASRVKEGTKDYFEPAQYDTLASIDLDWFGIRMQ